MPLMGLALVSVAHVAAAAVLQSLDPIDMSTCTTNTEGERNLESEFCLYYAMRSRAANSGWDESYKHSQSTCCTFCDRNPPLDHETLDAVLQLSDLRHQIARFVGGDGSRNDGARDTAGATKSSLAGNIDVRDVLVLSQKRQMEEDGERRGVGGEHNDLRGTAVEGLGRCGGSQ